MAGFLGFHRPKTTICPLLFNFKKSPNPHFSGSKTLHYPHFSYLKIVQPPFSDPMKKSLPLFYRKKVWTSSFALPKKYQQKMSNSYATNPQCSKAQMSNTLNQVLAISFLWRVVTSLAQLEFRMTSKRAKRRLSAICDVK